MGNCSVISANALICIYRLTSVRSDYLHDINASNIYIHPVNSYNKKGRNL